MATAILVVVLIAAILGATTEARALGRQNDALHLRHSIKIVEHADPLVNYHVVFTSAPLDSNELQPKASRGFALGEQSRSPPDHI